MQQITQGQNIYSLCFGLTQAESPHRMVIRTASILSQPFLILVELGISTEVADYLVWNTRDGRLTI